MNQFARPGLGVTELPSFNENDKGKVLKIDSETGVLGWGEAGGSGLPSTDAASAGDVLSLDNSKDPQWSAPSSGGGVLVVNMSYSEDLETITADKTASEMWSAAQSGIILAKSAFTGMTRIELVTTAEYSDETGYIFAVGSNYSLYASAGTDYPSNSGGGGANY